MTVKVLEVDVAQPLPSFTDHDIERYPFVQILVRKHGQPVGYTWIHARSQHFLREEFIRIEIERQLYDSFNRIELERQLGTQPIGVWKDTPYNWPSVTVGLCTRGRPESLERALKSLLLLDYPTDKLEVLVVDNAPPDDATEKVVAHFPQFSYVVEPRPGLDWARNRAIKEAQGEIIAYTDDDVAVDSLWLKAIVRPFEEPNVMCVTGLVAPAERDTDAQNWFEEYNGFGKGFEKRYYVPGMRRNWAFFPLGSGGFGTGANMAYRKSLFERVGGFDEALDVGTPTHGAGDLEMYYRTLHNGFTLVYEPQALIWHYHRRDYKVLKGQIRDWGRGVYAFWTKVFLTDPDMRWLALWFGIVWYWRGFLKRLIKRGGSHRNLRIGEAIGALQGPTAYILARRKANRIAAATWPETTVRRGVPTTHSSDIILKVHGN
ncbi:MAG: glycosyltransferase [Chloroflexi bacterium]|uniref:Glycosyltransferase n=1 Tax=Candidatus Chlorohelix allophototropha TaxID=3003348 RepID=A0A8T7M737_9CHLR|nr:glycosyltransferase [Chloroflexota bacterium]WJW69832.1 glycosyltransferase [Chloroflexota bacterium L227-S17]